MDWTWFHRLGSPRWFYQKTGGLVIWLGVLAVALLATGVVWGLLLAPTHSTQGNSYRILYVHAPAAMISMMGYYIMAIAGGIGLIWRMKMAELVVRAAAPLGAAITFLALLSGAIWGKPTWGTYWFWDARLTSTLVLFFLYLGVIALNNAFEKPETGFRACAILALVGTVNIPIIYFSVDWWFTLHQGASLKMSGESAMHPSMKYPLLLMILAMYCYYFWVLLLWVRQEVLERERKTRWVIEMISAKTGENG